MFPRPSRVTRLSILVVLALCLLLAVYILPPGGRVVNWDGPVAMGYTTRLPGQPAVHLGETRRQTAGLRDLELEPSGGKYPSSPADEHHVNPHNFNYLHNPSSLCPRRSYNTTQLIKHPQSKTLQADHRDIVTNDDIGKGQGDVSLLVYIHSAPGNLKKRQAVRQTWAHPSLLHRLGAAVVFLLGRSVSQHQQELLDLEASAYGDIVQEDFVDHYRNLTYKGVAGLRWASVYCPSAVFLLKTDDDILVDLVSLVSDLRKRYPSFTGGDITSTPTHLSGQHSKALPKEVVLCNLWTRMKVMRDPKSKWYIPPSDFKPDYFPPYCSGSAFLLSADLAPRLYRASLDAPFFWVDDYYVTGVLVSALGLKHARYNQAYLLNANVAEARLVNDSREYLFFHVKKLSLYLKLWPKLLRRHLNDPDVQHLLPEVRPTPNTIVGQPPGVLAWERAQRLAASRDSTKGEAGEADAVNKAAVNASSWRGHSVKENPGLHSEVKGKEPAVSQKAGNHSELKTGIRETLRDVSVKNDNQFSNKNLPEPVKASNPQKTIGKFRAEMGRT